MSLFNFLQPKVMHENSIHEILKQRAHLTPYKIAFRFLKEKENYYESINYKELYAKSVAISYALLDCKKNTSLEQTKVLLLFPSGLDFIAAFFGCLNAGYIAIPTSLPQGKRSLERLSGIIGNCKPSVILSDKKTYNAFSNKGISFEQNIEWIATDDVEIDDTSTLPLLDLPKIAFIQYSSGSTSTPKGVMVSHENILANQSMIKQSFMHSEKNSIVGWLPLFHDMGLIGNILHPIYIGIPCTLMSPVAFLQKPIRWLEAISTFKATTSGAPNFAYDLCASRIDLDSKKKLDLSSWTVAFNGSEKIHIETLERFEKAFRLCQFKKSTFFSCYGLAEATLLVTGTQVGFAPKVLEIDQKIFEEEGKIKSSSFATSTLRYVSVGRPPAGSLAIVHPETYVELPYNTEGEIWVSGDHVALGYLNQKKLTQTTFEATPVGKHTKFLRTGDLGFIDKEGELFVCGRLKELIILRGRNVHPQDVERSILNLFDEFQENGIAAFSHLSNQEEKLVVVCEIKRTWLKKINSSELKQRLVQHISSEFQAQLFDVLFIKTNRLPKTSSGKIQRLKAKSLYELEQFEPIETSEYKSKVKNQTQLQSELCSLLKIEINDPSIPLSSFGIDSLQAIEIQSFILDHYKIEISFEKILFQMSINDLENELLSSNATENPTQLPTSFPLSQQQKRLWFLQKNTHSQIAYNIALPLKISGKLNLEKLEGVIKQLTEIHSSLSCSFFTDGQNEPHQRIENLKKLPLFTHNSVNTHDIKQKLDEIAAIPYDLSSSPLFRIDVFKTSPIDFILVFSAHHIIADLWSMGVLLKDFLNLYHGVKKNTSPQSTSFYLKVQDENKYLRSNQKKENLAFWEQLISSCIIKSPFSYDYMQKGALSFIGNYLTFEVHSELHKKIKSIALKNQLTPFHLLFAAYYLFLRKISNQPNQIIGTTFSGRPHANWSKVIGFFANPMPFPIQLPKEVSFLDVAKEVKATTDKIYPHSSIPFSSLLDHLIERKVIRYSPSKHPLFSTMFVMQTVPSFSKYENFLTFPNDSEKSLEFKEFSVSPFNWRPKTSLYDASLFVTETEGSFLAHWEYNNTLFKKETIQDFCSCFLETLEFCTQNPMALSNNYEPVKASFPSKSGTLAEQFESILEISKHSIAISDDFNQYSFDFINQKSNQLAAFFYASGINPHDIVGIHFDYSIELICVVTSLIKLGVTFVPLDPKLNSHRKNHILKSSKTKFLISDQLLPLNFTLNTIEINSINQINSSFSFYPKNTASSAIAYILYTSGSTGEPKGVMVSHHSLLNYLHQINEHYPLASPLKFAGFTSLSFDLSLTALFYPLLFGGSLQLYKRREDLSVTLENLLKNDSLTHLKLTPSHLETISNFEKLPKNLKTIIIGGEQLSFQLTEPLFKLNPNLVIINEYGPTETTIGVTFFKFTLENIKHGPAPIGSPFPIVSLKVDTSGDLSVSGPLTSYGYFNNPAHTAEVFTPVEDGYREYHTGDLVKESNDNLGELIYIGRYDRQIKTSGFRVDLSEIENALYSIPCVRQCIVTFKSNQINCYYILKERTSKDEIHKQLSYLLPPYMHPQSYIECFVFPQTTNGKIDVERLPPPKKNYSQRSIGVPETEEQKALLTTWSKVFKVDTISIYDNFFELGGDSIKAIQIIASLKKHQISFTLTDLFENPTIAQLSLVLNKQESTPVDYCFNKEKISLSPLQNQTLLSSKNIDHYNMGVLIHRNESTDLEKLKELFKLITNKHPILKSVFYSDKNSLFSKIPSNEQSSFEIREKKFDSEEEIKKQIPALISKNQLQTRLLNGPLIRIVLLNSRKSSKVLLLIHHFIMDGVSWRILLSEFNQLLINADYKLEYSKQKEVAPYGYWIQEMYKQSFEKSKQYWNTFFKHANMRTEPGLVYNYQNRKVLDLEFNEDLFSRLTNISKRLFKVSIQDLLLYIISFSWMESFKLDSLMLDIESHGRTALRHLDLSETIGWFTSKYPFIVERNNKENPYHELHTIHSKHRDLTDHKDNYLFLQNPSHPRSSFCFNFLGEIEAYDSFNAEFILQGNQSKDYLTPYQIEINCWIKGGALKLQILYDHSISIEKYKNSISNYSKKIDAFTPCLDETLLLNNYHLFPHVAHPQKLVDSIPCSKEQVGKILPLFPSQYDLLIESIKSVKNDLFQEKVFFDFEGDLDFTTFKESFLILSQRHDALRTQIVFKDSLQPYQLISANGSIFVSMSDYSKLSSKKQRELIEKETSPPLEIGSKQLFKIFLFKTNENNYLCYWIFHHVILDGWSLSNLFVDWLTIYKTLTSKEVSPKPTSFETNAYFTWLNYQSNNHSLQFWKSYLLNYASKPLSLQNSLGNPSNTSREEFSIFLQNNDYEKLKHFALKNTLTLNTLFQFFWGFTLSIFSDSSKSIFASVVSGRPSNLPDIDQGVGLFTNVVPTVYKQQKNDDLLDALIEFQKIELKKDPHTYTPFSEILTQSPELDVSALTLFVFENYPFSGEAQGLVEQAGLPFKLKNAFLEEKTGYDLTLSILPSDKLEITTQFNPDKYKKNYVEQLINFYLLLLRNIEEITKKNALTSWLKKSNSYFSAQLKTTYESSLSKNLLQNFQECVCRTPHKIALVEGEKQFSYGALDKLTDLLAHSLIQSGAKLGEIIGVSYGRSANLLIAYLSILKSGATYLPLDSKWPLKRTLSVLSQSQVKRVISPKHLNSPDGLLLFDIDEVVKGSTGCGAILDIIHPKLPAYVLFTSGSTGLPKGIQVPHCALLNHFLWTKSHFNLSSKTKMLQMTETTFDVSLSEFHTIFSGGTLHILSETIKKDPILFFKFIDQHKITHVQLVPSFLKVLNNIKTNGNFSIVNHVLCGAESISKNDLDLFFKKFNIPLSNIYGLTETCIDSVSETFLEPPDSETIPIGNPIRATYCYLFDHTQSPTQAYVPGELYIGGLGLALGYLNNPTHTAELFIPDPTKRGERLYKTRDLCYWDPDHKLVFLGRIDQQVKIRGMRVELNEIEVCLHSHPLVTQAVILPKKTTESNVDLYAFYSASNPIRTEDLQNYMKSKLPHYMQPSLYSFLKEVPMTPSGKVDRKKISQMTTISSQLNYLTNSKTEKELQSIWSLILGRTSSGIDPNANFFDIGGNSLGVMRMQTEVNRTFNKEYGIDVFFREASIKNLASFIENEQNTDTNSSDITQRLQKQTERHKGKGKWKRPTL